jgi:hypothetical protein
MDPQPSIPSTSSDGKDGETQQDGHPAFNTYPPSLPSSPSPLSSMSPIEVPTAAGTTSSPSVLSPTPLPPPLPPLPEQDVGDFYWPNDSNPSQFTFYREGTPTTPPLYPSDQEKTAVGAYSYLPEFPAAEATYTGGIYVAGAKRDCTDEEQSGSSPARPMKIWGLSILVVRCLLGVFVFAVVSISVGLGVGLSLGRTGGYPLANYPGRFVYLFLRFFGVADPDAAGDLPLIQSRRHHLRPPRLQSRP